jgi:protein SCO1/2
MPKRIFWIVLLALLTACGAETTQAPPLTLKGVDISQATDFAAPAAPGSARLALTDHNDRPVTLDSFQGKLVVLFFGYTHCPDVCPTTLADMARALKLLPAKDAEQVRVLFVTVDPERDTAEVLKAYVPFFHPDFLGLRGTPEQVARAAREFRIVYRKHVEPGADDYLIDHSAGSYILDARGRLRVYLPFASPPEDVAHDLAALLRAG